MRRFPRTMEAHPLEYAGQIGILIVAGLIGGRILRRFGLPEISGYLVMGFLLGPHALGLIGATSISDMHFIEELALAFIAFTIGLELNLVALRRIESGIVPIAILQSVATASLVTLGTFAISRSWPIALLLGAMATATSPGEVMLIIRELRASGPVTRTCLGVVALDDALGVALFALIVPVAALLGGIPVSATEALLIPLQEIVGSLVVGILLGLILARVLHVSPSHGFALATALTTVFLATGLSHLWHLSPLLTCLAVGTTAVNQYPYVSELLHDLDEIMGPLHVVFFGGIGASLNLDILTVLTPVTVIYTTTRALGKLLGSRAGASYSHAPQAIRNYLWPTLLPQAGINVGLIALVGAHFPELREPIAAVMLASSAIYAVLGFPLAHIALTRAGEAHVSGAEKAA